MVDTVTVVVIVTKRVIKSRKANDKQYIGKKKGQTIIYNTLHRKPRIEQHEPH